MIFTNEEKETLNKFQEKKVVEEEEETTIKKFSNSRVVSYCGFDKKKKKFTAKLTTFGKGLLLKES